MATKKKVDDDNISEEFKISGKELLEKVKEIIREGNASKLIIKSEKGEIVFSLSLTFGVVGAILAPYLAVIGGLAALLTKCTVIVERHKK